MQLIFYWCNIPFVINLHTKKGIKIPQQAAFLKLQTAVRQGNAGVKINTGIPVRMPVEIYSIHERLLKTAQQ